MSQSFERRGRSPGLARSAVLSYGSFIMAPQTAVRLHLHVAKDRVVRLPDAFPEGDAEVIVLHDAAQPADQRARKAALRKRAFGADAGLFVIADDFDAALPPDVQRFFEGEDDGPMGQGS